MIIVPYVGSKDRISPILKANLTDKVGMYIEPFSGMFSLGLWSLRENLVDSVLINDVSEEIMNFWGLIRDDPWSLIADIEQKTDLIQSGFEKGKPMRDIKIELDESGAGVVHESALFVLYRRMNGGSADRYVTYKGESMEAQGFVLPFVLASKLLQGAVLSCCSFEALAPYNAADAFWYFDPPYKTHEQSHYYRNAVIDHTALRDFCRGISGRFMLSHTYTPEIADLYKDFCIKHIYLPSTQVAGKYTHEVLVSNFEVVVPANFLEEGGVKKQFVQQPKMAVQSENLSDWLEWG